MSRQAEIEYHSRRFAKWSREKLMPKIAGDLEQEYPKAYDYPDQLSMTNPDVFKKPPEDYDETKYIHYWIITKEYSLIIDAINDFNNQLKNNNISPEGKKSIFWRHEPELFGNTDFGSDKILYRIETRFSYELK